MFKHILLAFTALAAAHPAFAAPTLFGDRASFLAALGTSVTDGYEATEGYPMPLAVLGDAEMTAVLGETRYETTGFANTNVLVGAGGSTVYCAGCNGSFTLHFDQTSQGGANGVFGVGLDIVANAGERYTINTVFGDGSTESFRIGAFGFVGATSTRLFRSISFPPDGLPSQEGFFAIDNLTIGTAAVPEPATWALLIAGFGLVGAVKRRRSASSLAA